MPAKTVGQLGNQPLCFLSEISNSGVISKHGFQGTGQRALAARRAGVLQTSYGSHKNSEVFLPCHNVLMLSLIAYAQNSRHHITTCIWMVDQRHRPRQREWWIDSEKRAVRKCFRAKNSTQWKADETEST